MANIGMLVDPLTNGNQCSFACQNNAVATPTHGNICEKIKIPSHGVISSKNFSQRMIQIPFLSTYVDQRVNVRLQSDISSSPMLTSFLETMTHDLQKNHNERTRTPETETWYEVSDKLKYVLATHSESYVILF